MPVEETGQREGLSHVTLTASAGAIVAVDDRGIVQLVNPAAETLFARPRGQLVGSTFGYPLAEGAVEVDLILPDRGPQVVEMRVTATRWKDRQLYVASLRDVTRQREATHELQSALEQQNLVVGMAAHQLRNPLATISVLVDVLRYRQAHLSDAQRAELLDRIAERTAHLQALVRKLLVAERINTGVGPAVPQPVPVLEVLLECLAVLGSTVDIRVNCSPELVVRADRAEFTEMLTNYLENAVVHGAPPVVISAEEVDGEVEIRFCDAGPGVAEALVGQLYLRFARIPTTQADDEGTGLGLWIVRSLAQRNHGNAWYEPNPPGGSCFCLRLPKVTSSAHAAAARTQ